MQALRCLALPCPSSQPTLLPTNHYSSKTLQHCTKHCWALRLCAAQQYLCSRPPAFIHVTAAVKNQEKICMLLTLMEHSPWLAPADGSFLYSCTSRLSRRSLLCSRCASCSTSDTTPATTRDSRGASLDLWLQRWQGVEGHGCQHLQPRTYHSGSHTAYCHGLVQLAAP